MGLNDIISLARTDFRGANRIFGIKRNDRRQHMYVIGKTGTGKSVFLKNMIVQDIAHGEGLCLVDPHGESVEYILKVIPESRKEDVIYFNPADPDFHMGFNILELPDPKYKHLVASGLMGIFTKIWANVWSARMEYILNNAVLALLETPGSTLLGIPRLLVDKEYRARIVGNVTDPVVKAFWMNEFESWQEKFRNEAIAPIQNKVGQFLSTALIRNVVGQSKSTIDIYRLMNEGKIFLVNVSKGRIGEDNSALLGAMLITKIQLAAMERVRIPNEDDRKDFFLYVDEFQNFATDSFAGILSEARKYRLNLTIAHQYIGQLVTDVSTKVRDAVFGNVGTMVAFRVGAADAEFLEKEFSPEFMMQDLVNLPNFCIYLKLMVDGMTCRPFSATTLAPLKGGSRVVSPDEIVEYSRTHYCRPRSEVEREINQWSGIFIDEETTTPQTERERKVDDKDEGDGFKAHCSRCDKKITLPFAPESGRPVYCKTCFTKVKEERAIAGSSRYAPELAELGIEFPLKSEAKKEERPRVSTHQAPRVPPPPKPKSISLASLTPADPTIQPRVKEQKDSVDIQALRDAIRKSLGTNPS